MDEDKINKLDEQIKLLNDELSRVKNELEDIKKEKTINPIKLLKRKKLIKEKEKFIANVKNNISNANSKKEKVVKQIENKIANEKKRAERKAKREELLSKLKVFYSSHKLLTICGSVLVIGVLAICGFINNYNSTLHDIKFYSGEDSIFIGDTLNLEYKISPKNYELEGEIEYKFNGDMCESDKDGYIAITDGDLLVSIVYNGKTYDQKTVHIKPIELENYIVTDKEIVLNHSIDLDIEPYPSDATYFEYYLSSSNNNIVKVENNTLYGTGEGSSIITVTSKDGKIKNSFNANVVNVNPDTVEFVDDLSNCVVGNEYEIKIKYTPDVISNNDFEIVSSNEAILRVNNNKVKATGIGFATLTIKHPSGISCSEDINVKYPPIEEVSIIGYPKNDMSVGQTYQLKYEYEPKKADEVSFKWESDDETIVKVNSAGVVTAIASGSATIYLTSKNGVSDHVNISVVNKQKNSDSLTSPSGDVKDNSAGGSTNVNSQKETEEVSGAQDLVWIPTNGGKKYHSHAGCSNMSNPKQVTRSEAQAQGFTACKRCY